MISIGIASMGEWRKVPFKKGGVHHCYNGHPCYTLLRDVVNGEQDWADAVKFFPGQELQIGEPMQCKVCGDLYHMQEIYIQPAIIKRWDKKYRKGESKCQNSQ